ncbi:MAG: fructose-6-phosphate aldolase [archaeon]|jgi:transaldolase|nr:fructose-6-phosphate aldolase [archaeon]
MQIWIDTADVNEIKRVAELGVVDGATTNPSLCAKQSNTDFKAMVKEICGIVNGPVSAEVVAPDFKGMCAQAEMLSKLHENVIVKIPCTNDGLKATKYCKEHGIKTNVTLTFSPNQVLLAAKAGATYTNIFIGRVDDAGHDGMVAVEESLQILENYKLETKLIAASVRSVQHVQVAALLGCHVATIPPKIIEKMIKHPLTELGLKQFEADWIKSGCKME